VHARGQVAHVDLPAYDDRLGTRLNGALPADVRVLAARPAPVGFDARFSALSRRYRYRVTDAIPDPLRRRDTLAHPRPVGVDAMRAAAAPLVGEHDFAAYCRARDGASTIRRLQRLEIYRGPDGVVRFDAEADAFCHHMVRSLVGALLAVGEGRREPGWPAELLGRGVRDGAVDVVPAHGLTLVEVCYPPDAALAARVAETRRRRGSQSRPSFDPAQLGSVS
jgi:tRNA pseudouridine38-40 synthase